MERKLFRHLRLRLRATKQAFIIVRSLVCKTHCMMVLVVTISMTALSKKCKIISVTDRIGLAGFITAQGRNAANEPTGYVFNDCHVNGTGPIFLGRPYRNYSRVVFASTYMGNIITPEGWSEWLTGPLNLTTLSEVNCKGPGADMSRRVSWEKKLSNEEVAYLTNTTSFIDKEGWLEKQPK
ncbi:hypothetical protein GBA52_019802 [Prunus armeniaca]|nr:hypothetical protein GBA52_019802 [Prunus armeniaca]